MDIAWMAWTWQTAAFFGVIAGLLALMTVLALVRPETERVGVLRIPTTRGDRLFVSLLGSAFIALAWIALAPAEPVYALVPCLVYAAAVFRWV